MREPVLFHKAIDGIFAAETVPDVVLEIGPHQTLVSPIKQVRLHGGIDGAIGQPPTPTCPAPC